MSLTGARLVRYLLDLGAVDGAAIVDGGLVVSDCTRRHLNHKVRLRSSPGCFVKQARADQAMSGLTLQREAMCYWLAAHDPRFASLAPLLPRYVAYDRARPALVVELLADAENLSELHQRLGRVPDETAAALGLALGRAHADVRDPGVGSPGLDVFPRTAPWVLGIHGLVAQQVDRLSAANARLLAIVRGDSQVASALESLRSGWRGAALIHGDMKWDNCLVVVPAGDAPAIPRVVDWELADFGDGLWDVGGVFHSFLCAWLMSMPARSDLPAERLLDGARHPVDAMQPAMRAFWQAYARGAGIARSDERAALVRSLQYAAARLIQTAYEALTHAAAPTPPTLRLLQVATNVLIRPADALADLLDWRAHVPSVAGQVPA